MKSVRVCFLWHMHQPYYTDPVARSSSMPWVRLHAIEAYFDMAFLVEQVESARVTFNFTPSLLLQLQEQASGSIRDLFWEHSQRPAAELSSQERAFVVRHFFAANWSTMVRPYPRYHELLVKRGLDVRGQDLDRIARPFSAHDLLDLQVWHNLAWFGYGAVAQFPRIAALRQKDRGFTEADKHEVLSLQQQILSDVIPRYRRLAEAGRIELTTSPFYHPILPLLIDTDVARRARPDTALPQRFHAPEDAEAQIGRAVALHREVFGSAPAGMWPSEGSVCPEMIPMVRRAGIQWMASDEGILAKSLGQWQRGSDLYQAYRVGAGQDDVAVVFRDQELSDAIGFVYSKSTPEAGADNFLGRIANVVEKANGDDVLIPVILDGENAWEHYHDGGQRFLNEVYRALSSPGRLGTGTHVVSETMSRALQASPPTRRIEHLHSGSWINQDFKIWIGHAEDNRGWNLLRDTRERLIDVSQHLPPEQAAGAWDSLYAAEGSDWFWWYGDDFETDYKAEFDRLFRTHLRNVYLRLGLAAPDYLNEPIAEIQLHPGTVPVRMPVNLLSPIIDGQVSDFFEWRGAGTIDPVPPLGAMWTSRTFFSLIAFGFNLQTLYLRLDPTETVTPDIAAELHILTGPLAYKASFPLSQSNLSAFTLWTATPGDRFTEVGQYSTVSRRSILELAIPFKDMKLEPGQEFRLSLILTQRNLEIARYPYTPLTLVVPDEHFEAALWRV